MTRVRPEETSSAVHHLVVLDSLGQVERNVPLQERAVTIGRHADNDLVIKDELASRFHCTIEPDGAGGWRLRDLGSRNGTRVNNVKVADAPLQTGDTIRIGAQFFRIDTDAGVALTDDPTTIEEVVKQKPDRNAGLAGIARMIRGDRADDGAEASAAWATELRSLAASLGAVGNEPVSLIDARGKKSDALSQSAGGGATPMRLLLLVASRSRATDLHVEPKGEAFNARLRVDGQMLSLVDLPNTVGELVLGLVKTACQMKIAGRDAVHDGHFSATVADRRLDFRASLTPSVHGQKLVLRVLNSADAPERLSDMGLSPWMHERIRKGIEKDAGLLLVCGPTGCGKTTTLYNALREIDRERRNVVTIEDPVEHHLDHVTQIPVNHDQGATFGSLLRSVLRQDPDVILVGEVRDEETARVAMQAAMTGHLVFSTVHSKDTIGAVFRLLDLGVEPYLVANSLDVIVAQRLVRVLCEHCKRPVRVTPAQATRMGRFLENRTEVFSPTGCAKCLRTGFRGRQAIFEMLEFTNDLRDVVLKEPSIQAMRKVIEQGLFTNLTQSGWQLVARGVTSLDEVDRVASSG